MKETKINFIDYLKDKRDYYKAQIDFCKSQLNGTDHYSIDYKSYKWQLCDYEARLDAITELLSSVKGKEY